MAAAKLGQRGAEGFFNHLSGGRNGQNFCQGRAPQAVHRAKLGASGHQNGAAATDIGHHVVDILHRQDAPHPVAIKDDEIKFVNLFNEELPRREGNQRQFIHRHTILLFRRAQNGEMHQIHRRVRLQQVAPNPFARMRLTRNQEHPQPVAHAVDLHHGGVVAVGQLVLHRGQREMQHVLPAMRQGHRQFQIGVDRHREGHWILGIHGNGDLGLRAQGGGRALIFDPQLQRELLADDSKGRGIGDDKAAVPIAGAPGQQHMQRCRQAGGKARIMHLPVGDDHRTGNPRTRLGGNRLGQRGHGQTARIFGPIRKADHAQFGVLQRRHRS